jgi:hypothetical protein
MLTPTASPDDKELPNQFRRFFQFDPGSAMSWSRRRHIFEVSAAANVECCWACWQQVARRPNLECRFALLSDAIGTLPSAQKFTDSP